MNHERLQSIVIPVIKDIVHYASLGLDAARIADSVVHTHQRVLSDTDEEGNPVFQEVHRDSLIVLVHALMQAHQAWFSGCTQPALLSEQDIATQRGPSGTARIEALVAERAQVSPDAGAPPATEATGSGPGPDAGAPPATEATGSGPGPDAGAPPATEATGSGPGEDRRHTGSFFRGQQSTAERIVEVSASKSGRG